MSFTHIAVAFGLGLVGQKVGPLLQERGALVEFGPALISTVDRRADFVRKAMVRDLMRETASVPPPTITGSSLNPSLIVLVGSIPNRGSCLILAYFGNLQTV